MSKSVEIDRLHDHILNHHIDFFDLFDLDVCIAVFFPELVEGELDYVSEVLKLADHVEELILYAVAVKSGLVPPRRLRR